MKTIRVNEKQFAIVCHNGSSCTFGNKCRYLHPERSAVSINSKSTSFGQCGVSVIIGTKKCRFGSKCKYGSECEFSHTDEEMKKFDENDWRDVKKELAEITWNKFGVPLDQPCRNGFQCPYKLKCKYSHTPAEMASFEPPKAPEPEFWLCGLHGLEECYICQNF